MKTLVEIFSETGHFGKDIGINDKNSTHSYLPTYDKLFEPYRNARNGVRILEIGVAMGHSLKMWDEYFDHSLIIGVDISLMVQPFESKNNNQIVLIEANATNPGFLDGWNNFDIVIDDGEHTHQSQIATFEILKKDMNNGGIYIIEDILSPEISLQYLQPIHNNCEVVDLRSVKGRFDDMMLIYRF